MGGTAPNFDASSSRKSAFQKFVDSLQVPTVLATKLGREPVKHGGFADVWKRQRLPDETLVAIKIIRIPPDSPDLVLARLNSHIAREVHVWSRLEHPNVLPFYGVCPQMAHEHLWLVAPWMDNGVVRLYLRAHPEADFLALIRGFVKGVIYLHEQRIVHDDIKGANILVDNFGEARLCDFGLSKLLDDLPLRGETTSSMFAGSVRWMAPERIDPDLYQLTASQAQSFASDVWSVGMTIYEILACEYPYRECRTVMQISRAVTRGDKPPQPGTEARRRGLSHRLWSFLSACWKLARADRPNLSDALRTVPEDPSMGSPDPRRPKGLVRENWQARGWLEISLAKGETICNVENWADGWWFGRNARGQQGIFPGTHLNTGQDASHGWEHGRNVHSDERSHPARGETLPDHRPDPYSQARVRLPNERAQTMRIPVPALVSGVPIPLQDRYFPEHVPHEDPLYHDLAGPSEMPWAPQVGYQPPQSHLVAGRGGNRANPNSRHHSNQRTSHGTFLPPVEEGYARHPHASEYQSSPPFPQIRNYTVNSSTRDNVHYSSPGEQEFDLEASPSSSYGDRAASPTGRHYATMPNPARQQSTSQYSPPKRSGRSMTSPYVISTSLPHGNLPVRLPTRHEEPLYGFGPGFSTEAPIPQRASPPQNPTSPPTRPGQPGRYPQTRYLVLLEMDGG